MPQITIGDVTGSAQVDVSPASLLGKNKLFGLKAVQLAVEALPKPVTDPTFKDAQFGATFENASIPLEGNTVDAKAGVNSKIAVARAADSPLFGSDDFDVDVRIADKDCWVSFELNTVLGTSLAVPLPDGFGVSFGVSTAPDFATYVLIPGSEAPAPTLKEAIGTALNAFNILVSPNDVLGIPENVIYTTDIPGTIKVGGSWTLPLAVNQLSLADADLPFNNEVTVSPALNVTVAGDIALTAEFSVRFRRTAAHTLRVGLYKKAGRTFEVSFTESAGLAAHLGSSDLIGKFFKAVAPEIDQGSLSDADFAKIHQVLTDSINRSLAVSLNVATSATLSDAAAFVYEIDIAAPGKATQDAIHSALHGDWTGIRSLPQAKEIRDVIKHTVETKFSWTVNLLGVFNYRSLSDFVRTIQIVGDPEAGSVVITDTATAKRIASASTPLAADPDRLRKALLQSFVATATYQGLMTGMGADPAFGSTQDLLVYKDSMSFGEALKNLNAGEVLGVVPITIKAGLSTPGGRVSHPRIAASCTYSNEDVLRFFFSDIAGFTPRLENDLIEKGREVLIRLLDPKDPTDNKRILHLQTQAEWDAMANNPAGIPEPYASDYLLITWWAGAIAKVGPVLAKTIEIGKNVKVKPTEDPEFMKQRSSLASTLEKAVRNTHSVFEQGFAICAMATLAGRTPGTPPPNFEASWNGKSIFSNVTPKELTKGAGS